MNLKNILKNKLKVITVISILFILCLDVLAEDIVANIDEENNTRVIEYRKKYGKIYATIDVVDYPVMEILQEIADIKNVNIIFSPKVKGSFTCRIPEMEINKLFEKVLKSNGLGYEKEKNIIRVATIKELNDEKKKMLEIAEASLAIAPLITRTVYLNYADLKSVENNVKKLLTPKRGTVKSDDRTKQLIITDVAENFPVIYALITQLDVETRQVLIEVKILQLNYRDIQGLGIYWNTANYVNPIADPQVEGAFLGAESPDASAPNKSRIILRTVNDKMSLDAAISSLISEDRAKVISNPKIVTMNSVKATINIGNKIPLRVVTEKGDVTTQLTNIGTQIMVEPMINPDNNIIMKIHPEVSSIAGELGGGILIDTTEIDTNVLLGDGETLVLGGLIRDEQVESRSGIPFLKDIPILKYLFSSRDTTISRSELLIFVTPTIIK